MSQKRVTTAEELDALPEGSVVLDKFGDVSQLRAGAWCSYETRPMESRRLAKYLPATVIYSPKEA